jgi:glutamine amidotransferase
MGGRLNYAAHYMKVVVVRYTGGNSRSILNALLRQGIAAKLSEVPEEILAADKVIFPGVGEAGSAMEFLRARKLDLAIKKVSAPFLGICLGMQLLANASEEGDAGALGIFNVTVKKLSNANNSQQKIKIPHVGWNRVNFLKKGNNILKGLKTDEFFYFVHSYAMPLFQESVAITDHGAPFTSVVARDNFYGVQFHPEKSGIAGDKLLKNFLEL